MCCILTCIAVVIASTGKVVFAEPREEVEIAIRLVWPDDIEDWAVRVAQCESDLGQNSNTYNNVHTGTFQFSIATWKPFFEGFGYSWDLIVNNPYWNAWAAYIIYVRSGPGAWPICQFR